MFRHGLRVSEVCGLGLSRVDIDSRVLHVARLKKGLSTMHPLRPDEIKLVKAWLAIRAKMKPQTDAFFVSERSSALSRKTAWLEISNYGKLADQGADTRLIHDHLGHRDIRHTVIYTATNPARFERLWR